MSQKQSEREQTEIEFPSKNKPLNSPASCYSFFIRMFLMLFLSVFIFFGSVTLAFASGENNTPNVSPGLALATRLQQQGDSLLEIMGYREAEILFNKAYEIAKRLKETKLQGKIANNLAECYSMTGRHQQAEDMYHKAYALFGSIHDTNAMAVMLINLGDEYAKTGRIELAAETELKAIKLKEDNHDYRKLAFYYQKLGELFIDRDNLRWEFYCNKALELSRTAEYTTLRATVAIYNDMGAIGRIKGDFTRAAAFYDTMFRISEKADYKKGIATATSEKALLYLDMKRYKEALPLAEKAYLMVLDTDDDYHIVNNATLMARILIKLGENVKAISLLRMVVERAHKAGLLEDEMAGYKYLTQAYRASANWEAALLAIDRYTGMKDSLDGVEVRRALNDMQTRFETEKKQQLIDRLNEKNRQHVKRNQMLVIILIVSFLALLFLILILRLRNRTIRQNISLRTKETEIHRLEKARLTLDLEYRTRELTAATVHLINKNEVLTDLKNKLSAAESGIPELKQVLRQIDQNINLDNDWQNFSCHFEQVHPDFFKRLTDKYPCITPNEERLCAYLLINLNTKEISQMLNVTGAAVDKSRNRLRKKLEIAPDINLNEFLKTV